MGHYTHWMVGTTFSRVLDHQLEYEDSFLLTKSVGSGDCLHKGISIAPNRRAEC